MHVDGLDSESTFKVVTAEERFAKAVAGLRSDDSDGVPQPPTTRRGR
jgi:hypothetical protein